LWAGAVVVVALGSLGYTEFVRPNTHPKNFGVVEEGKLYRSGELTPAATEKVVREHHVRTIVDLGAYVADPVAERVASRTAAALGLERHVFRLEGDGTGNPNAYVEALRIIQDPAKQPVLVHCSAGSQRTGACVLLYREIVQGKAIDTQWEEAYSHGHDPARNPKLKPYLEQWHAKIGEAVRNGKLIEGEPAAEVKSVEK